jgi:myosin heavy subunit
LADDVVACLRLSENDLIKGIFNPEAAGGGGGKKGGRGKRDAMDAKKKMRASVKHTKDSMARKPKKLSTGATFKKSLMELKDNLMASEPHFIRTIKPNHQKVPATLDDDLIMRQLKYTGMLETTRIRREGYPGQ